MDGILELGERVRYAGREYIVDDENFLPVGGGVVLPWSQVQLDQVQRLASLEGRQKGGRVSGATTSRPVLCGACGSPEVLIHTGSRWLCAPCDDRDRTGAVTFPLSGSTLPADTVCPRCKGKREDNVCLQPKSHAPNWQHVCEEHGIEPDPYGQLSHETTMFRRPRRVSQDTGGGDAGGGVSAPAGPGDSPGVATSCNHCGGTGQCLNGSCPLCGANTQCQNCFGWGALGGSYRYFHKRKRKKKDRVAARAEDFKTIDKITGSNTFSGTITTHLWDPDQGRTVCGVSPPGYGDAATGDYSAHTGWIANRSPWPTGSDAERNFAGPYPPACLRCYRKLKRMT